MSETRTDHRYRISQSFVYPDGSGVEGCITIELDAPEDVGELELSVRGNEIITKARAEYADD